jgi:hypothetical protein
VNSLPLNSFAQFLFPLTSHLSRMDFGSTLNLSLYYFICLHFLLIGELHEGWVTKCTPFDDVDLLEFDFKVKACRCYFNHVIWNDYGVSANVLRPVFLPLSSSFLDFFVRIKYLSMKM